MIFLILLFTLPVFANFTPEAFVDTYYMWSFHEQDKRSFTTQPIRHHQPSVNLAHLGGTFKTKHWRSRLVLQVGDSVERNAAAEPGKEKYLQEAYIGYHLTPNTWLDGGIFLSHIGIESWISRDNPNYSRALMSDYVPYYQAGLRLEHTLTEESHLQLHLLQGWQNISETNSAKAVGLQFRWQNFTYNNFLGEEKAFRHYHDLVFKQGPLGAALDLGFEEDDTWGAVAAIWEQSLNESQSLAYRLEHYFDPRGVNVGARFITQSASVTFNQGFKKYWWRNELRGFYSEERIYPDKKHWDAFVVTSLSASY
jgi:hypothetical protein